MIPAFTSVFIRAGKKTYAAYNFSSRPLTAKFSDGATFEVPASSLATKQRALNHAETQKDSP